MKRNFSELGKFITVRDLFFYCYKIFMSIVFILFFIILFIIIYLSIRPRQIEKFNNYMTSKIINSDKNAIVSFASATLHLDPKLGLQYKITDFSYKNINEINIQTININIDFVKLLYGNLFINKIELRNGHGVFYNKNNNKQENKKIEIEEDFINKINRITKDIYNIALKIKEINIINITADVITKDKKNKIILSNYKSQSNIKYNKLFLTQHLKLKLNNQKFPLLYNSYCSIYSKNSNCHLKLKHLNLTDFKDFFYNETKLYEYTSNIKGLLNIDIEFNFNSKNGITDGKFIINSNIGSFYLKDFFEQKIIYSKLSLLGIFNNNFRNISINSLKTKLNDVDFLMGLDLSLMKDNISLDLLFGIKNISFQKLNQLWPINLGTDDVRPWVLSHIISGKSPQATATMNIKYFTDENKKDKSGLQHIYSEVELENALLNYSNTFPTISNINGLAIFTENDMLINIDEAKVLNSNISNSSVKIDFTKQNKDVIIDINAKGPIADLFIHIDKDDATNIKEKLNRFIEDYYTNSNIKLNIPLINNLDFNMISINVNSNLKNKINSVLKNSSNINLTFNKKKNKNILYGNIDFTNSYIEYLYLNFIKPSKTKFSINYKLELDEPMLFLTELKPISKNISFIADGSFNLFDGRNKINIRDIKYNQSDYSIYFESNTADYININEILITGEQIDYSNILDNISKSPSTKIKNKDTNKKNIKQIKIKENKVDNILDIKANINKFIFNNDKYLFSPIINLKLINDDIDVFELHSFITKQIHLNGNLNKKEKLIELSSNNFGEIFNTFGLINKIYGGSGMIALNTSKLINDGILVGNIKIDNKFLLQFNDTLRTKFSTDLLTYDEYFNGLKDSLGKSNQITIDKLSADFILKNNILTFKDIIADSKDIHFQMLALGFINIVSGEIKLSGLLVPFSLVNSLFGISKIPLIGDILFGKQNSGLFASNFLIYKKNTKKDMDIKISKTSMFMPGAIRKLFKVKEPVKN